MRKWVEQLGYAVLSGAGAFALMIGLLRVGTLTPPCGCGEAGAYGIGVCLCVIGGASLLNVFSKRSTAYAANPAISRLCVALSGLCGLVSGIMLISLGSAYPGGPTRQTVAIAVLLVAVLFTTGAETLIRRYYSADRRLIFDHNSLRISRVTTPILIVWAGFAQIGLPVRFTPLNFLVVLYAISYVVATVTGVLRLRSRTAD